MVPIPECGAGKWRSPILSQLNKVIQLPDMENKAPSVDRVG
jgi:hypothetical protein